MCDICDYMADEDPVKLDSKIILEMIAARMKNASTKQLTHLTGVVDKVIGFVEPENRETPSGLLKKKGGA